MKHLFRTLALAAALATAVSFTADAKKKKDLVEAYPALAPYFSTPVAETVQPDENGVIRRWLLLESSWTAISGQILIRAGIKVISRFLQMVR